MCQMHTRSLSTCRTLLISTLFPIVTCNSLANMRTLMRWRWIVHLVLKHPISITTSMSLIKRIAHTRLEKEISRLTQILKRTCNRNKMLGISVPFLNCQRSFQQENAGALNHYWISQNPRSSPLVLIVKAINVCWLKGRQLRGKHNAKQRKERPQKSSVARTKSNTQKW